MKLILFLKKFTNFLENSDSLKKYNTWIVSKYAIPREYNFGSRHFEFAFEFTQSNRSTLVITSNSNHLLGKTKPILPKTYNFIESESGIPTIWINSINYNSASSIRRIISWIDFEIKLLILCVILKSPDNVIISSLPLTSIISGYFLKLKGSKFILEIRDIWPLTLTDLGGHSKHNPLVYCLSILEKFGYKSADEIVGTMPNLKQHLVELGIKRDVKCIPQGFRVIPEIQNQSRLQDLQNKFIVTYAGSIGLTNNLGALFEVINLFRENDNIFFIILGDGELLEEYQKNNLNKNVFFGGRVPKKQVPEYLDISDVVYDSVMPKGIYNYGLSRNKWIDYMLAAKPLIISYYGFQSMLNEAECGYYIPSNSTNDLYNLLYKLVSEDKKLDLKMMGLNGQRWIIDNRHFQKLSQDYITLLN